MSFSEQLINDLSNARPVKLVTDIFFSPLYVGQAADIIYECMQRSILGTYNLGSSDNGISKAEFAKLIAAAFGLDISGAEFVTADSMGYRVHRPRDARMKVVALESILGHRLPTIEEGIKRYKMERSQ